MTSSRINSIDIIILNYNGEDILPQCLPSVVKASQASPVPCQVIVLDNRSSDKSLDYVRSNFPKVKIVISKENRVLFSYNELLPELESDIVILLNSDVKVEPDFIAPLIKHFNDDRVFAVAPKQLNFSGFYSGGKNKIALHFGLFKAMVFDYSKKNPVMEKQGYTMYEANSAYDRKIFIELGGFDEIYAPFTWEDTDLGFRAWKAGYKFAYEPESIIYHYECYSFEKEDENTRKRSVITKRNSFIFTWKNINDPLILAMHLILLPINLFIGVFYDRARVAAFFQSLKYLPRIVKSRTDNKLLFKLSDGEVLGLK